MWAKYYKYNTKRHSCIKVINQTLIQHTPAKFQLLFFLLILGLWASMTESLWLASRQIWKTVNPLFKSTITHGKQLDPHFDIQTRVLYQPSFSCFNKKLWIIVLAWQDIGILKVDLEMLLKSMLCSNVRQCSTLHTTLTFTQCSLLFWLLQQHFDN